MIRRTCVWLAGDRGPDMALGWLAGQQCRGAPGAGQGGPGAGRGDAGFDQLKPSQETPDFFAGVLMQLTGLIFGGELLASLTLQMPCRNGKVASRRDPVDEAGAYRPRRLGVEEVQSHGQHDRDRLPEVEYLPDTPVVQDLVRIGQVTGHRNNARSPGEEILGV